MGSFLSRQLSNFLKHSSRALAGPPTQGAIPWAQGLPHTLAVVSPACATLKRTQGREKFLSPIVYRRKEDTLLVPSLERALLTAGNSVEGWGGGVQSPLGAQQRRKWS